MHRRESTRRWRSPIEKNRSPFFIRYFREAAKWVSVVDLRHRGAAVERSKAPLHALDGVAMVSALCSAWTARGGNRRQAREIEIGYGATRYLPTSLNQEK
jgi:hypothetical protein